MLFDPWMCHIICLTMALIKTKTLLTISKGNWTGLKTIEAIEFYTLVISIMRSLPANIYIKNSAKDVWKLSTWKIEEKKI